jgi:hypothetical protein
VRLLSSLIAMVVLSGGVCLAQSPPPQNPRAPQEPRVISGWFGGGRPIDRSNPDPSTQELTVDLDVSGGYDDSAGINETTFLGTDLQYGGAIGAGAIDVQHRLGTRRNFIESSLSGKLRLASLGVRQEFAGSSGIRGLASLGRRSGVGAAYNVAYQPTYLFNAFGALNLAPADGDVPLETGPDGGITEQRWLSSTSSASLDRNWTTRQRSDVDYAYSTREPLTGAGLESRSQSVGFRHEWSPLENLSFQPRYRFTDNRQDELSAISLSAISLPLRMQHAGMDVRWQRRMVRDRLLTISLGGGATHTRRDREIGEPSELVGPSGAMAIQFRAAQRWSLAFNATRDVTMLDGLSPEAFTTDAFTLAMTGRLGRHAEVRLTGVHSRGTALTSSEGAFETSRGSAEWRYSLSRCCTLTVMYMYYDHEFAALPFAPIGFPSRQQRNSIRAGMSFWLPLFGSFQSE